MRSLAAFARKITKRLRRANRHGRKVFATKELATAIKNGSAINLTYEQALYALRAKSSVPIELRREMMTQFATALRQGHLHVYKLQLTQITNNHLKAIKQDYREMVKHVKSYLKTGIRQAIAAKKPDSVFVKVDSDERTQLKNGTQAILTTFRSKIDAAARKPYGDSYRKGKEAGVKKLKKVGVDVDAVLGSGEQVNASDAQKLKKWLDFHDDATEQLEDDIQGRLDDILDNVDDYEDEDDFFADVQDAVEVEDYRLPMYAWMGFSIAEDAQKAVLEEFNAVQAAKGEDEWKYKWLTAGDDDVCPICEEYGQSEPRYLDEWEDDPGGVHVYCRCDLEPIPPGEQE